MVVDLKNEMTNLYKKNGPAEITPGRLYMHMPTYTRKHLLNRNTRLVTSGHTSTLLRIDPYTIYNIQISISDLRESKGNISQFKVYTVKYGKKD